MLGKCSLNNVILGRQFCIWELLAWETLFFDFIIKPITATVFMWWGSSSYLQGGSKLTGTICV